MASSARKTSSTVTKIFRRRLFSGRTAGSPLGEVRRGRRIPPAGGGGLSLGRLLSPRPQFRERLPLVRGRFPVLGGGPAGWGARGSTGALTGGLPGFWARIIPELLLNLPPLRRPVVARPSGPPGGPGQRSLGSSLKAAR